MFAKKIVLTQAKMNNLYYSIILVYIGLQPPPQPINNLDVILLGVREGGAGINNRYIWNFTKSSV